MENKEKKNDVIAKEKEVVASSYIPINGLTREQIKGLSKVRSLFVPRVSKNSKSYTYEFPLHENGLIINSLGNNGRDRENISLDEFNAVRIYNNKFDSMFLKQKFEGPIFYRLVKGKKDDGSLYYSCQYWLSPDTKCHVHFFSGTEVSWMKGLVQKGYAKFNFIMKPEGIDDNLEYDKSYDLDDFNDVIL